MNQKILVVDDEKDFLDTLSPFLERSGFVVEIAQDGREGLQKVATFDPDLVILDVMMPQLDGREVCRRLRDAGDWRPVIMLTQVGGPAERALSMLEGADDYINKPFDPAELLARIQALLRRAKLERATLANSARLRVGPLRIDRQARRAWLYGEELPLKPKTFAVLTYLMTHAGEVVPRERLLNAVWGWETPTATRTVDVRIAELRKQLQDDPGEPRFIETVPGAGYRFVEDVGRQE